MRSDSEEKLAAAIKAGLPGASKEARAPDGLAGRHVGAQEWKEMRVSMGAEAPFDPIERLGMKVSGSDVRLGYGEGLSDVHVDFRNRATELQVGDVFVIASCDRLVVACRHMFPVHFTVIYDGLLPDAERPF